MAAVDLDLKPLQQAGLGRQILRLHPRRIEAGDEYLRAECLGDDRHADPHALVRGQVGSRARGRVSG